MNVRYFHKNSKTVVLENFAVTVQNFSPWGEDQRKVKFQFLHQLCWKEEILEKSSGRVQISLGTKSLIQVTVELVSRFPDVDWHTRENEVSPTLKKNGQTFSNCSILQHLTACGHLANFVWCAKWGLEEMDGNPMQAVWSYLSRYFRLHYFQSGSRSGSVDSDTQALTKRNSLKGAEGGGHFSFPDTLELDWWVHRRETKELGLLFVWPKKPSSLNPATHTCKMQKVILCASKVCINAHRKWLQFLFFPLYPCRVCGFAVWSQPLCKTSELRTENFHVCM